MKNCKGFLERAVGATSRFLPKYLYALACSAFLFTAGVFSGRHRFLIFQIAKHFGLKMGPDDRRLPVLPLSEILGREIDVRLQEPAAEMGNVTLLELLVIAHYARETRLATAFEIGTFNGRTALNIAANFPADGKVFTLDLPRSGLAHTAFGLAPGESAFVDKEVSGEKFLRTDSAQKIDQLYGDSATFDYSTYAGRMGLIFVDGSHAYEYVVQDTATALRLAGPGAVILWHDYQPDWPDVIQALNEGFAENPAMSGLRRIEGTSLAMLRCSGNRRES